MFALFLLEVVAVALCFCVGLRCVGLVCFVLLVCVVLCLMFVILVFFDLIDVVRLCLGCVFVGVIMVVGVCFILILIMWLVGLACFAGVWYLVTVLLVSFAEFVVCCVVFASECLLWCLCFLLLCGLLVCVY